MLDQIGVRACVERSGSLRTKGAIVRWGATRSAAFRSFSEPGFQVDRIAFDEQLLAAARALDITIVRPALASKPSRMANGLWYVPVVKRPESFGIHARYLVDASGKRAISGGSKRRISAPTLGLYGCWQGVMIPGAESLIEAGDEQWYWGAPLADRSFHAVVFVDPAAISVHGLSGLKRLYRDLIARSVLLRYCLRGRFESGVIAYDASARVCNPEIGDGFIKVGEAALSMDPLSSQGVQRAMVSALQAAIVVNTILRRPDQSVVAKRFYRDRHSEAVEKDKASGTAFYRDQAAVCPTPFWRRYEEFQGGPLAPKEQVFSVNSSSLPPPDTPLRLCSHAYFEMTPVLNKEFIESQPALVHRSLARPVAYLGDYRVTDLISKILPGTTLQEIAISWRKRMPESVAAQSMAWLWRHGILIREHAAS